MSATVKNSSLASFRGAALGAISALGHYGCPPTSSGAADPLLGLTRMRTYVPMRAFSFTVTEHDPTQPWIVIGREQRTVELEERADFFGWAREQWPEPRWTVELDPWQLSPDRTL